MDQLRGSLALWTADPQPWQMGQSPDRFRAMAQGRGHAERARSGLWVSLVAEHQAETVAQRPSLQLRSHRQRFEYHLDRPGPRHCLRLALVSGGGNGRHGTANRGRGNKPIAGAPRLYLLRAGMNPASIEVAGCWATLPPLAVVVAKRQPTSQRLNVAPNQRHIVPPPNDNNKLPLPAIGCCHGRTSRSRALLVSTYAPSQPGRRVS